MTTNITIRTEQPSDYRTVETIHRNAFWNLYVPGADEHYLAHILRDHGLRLFVGSLSHWGNSVDQGDDQAASCSKRTHAGARIISRKIGKLKAAIPSLGCRGF